MRFIFFLIKIFLVTGTVSLFGWTVWQNLTPSGVLEAHYDFNQISPFITSLLPGDRALAITKNAQGISYQAVIGDPVYLRLKTPRKFDRATVDVTFQNSRQPILELGGLVGRNPDVFDLQPLENKILDTLSWPRLKKDDLTLYQRNPVFKSIDEFLNHLPPRAEIATYHAAVDSTFRIPGYTPTATMQTIDYSLRGSHTFYAYVKNEALDVAFEVQDMNRDAGGDPLIITVYRDRTPVGTVSEPDDGRSGEREEAGTVHQVKLLIPGLPEGAYRIEFRSSRDMFIRSITTRSKKFVIANDVFLGDEAGYKDRVRPATLWTTGRVLYASTLHADGAQELTIGRELLRISEDHVEYVKRITGTVPTKLYSPHGDLLIHTAGVFAFSADALFTPEPIRMSWNIDLEAEGINYILANYETPQQVGDWKVARTTFDLSKMVWDGNAVPFVISAPGIAASQNEVRISNIAVRFERAPESLFTEFQTFLQRFLKI